MAALRISTLVEGYTQARVQWLRDNLRDTNVSHNIPEEKSRRGVVEHFDFCCTSWSQVPR